MFQSLPPAFAALAGFRQFCLYKTVPDPAKPNKDKKFPCNYLGEVISAHDSQFWMQAHEAIEWATYHGSPYGVAFVFAETDPFFFLDIDSCLQPDGQWSELAQQMMQAFEGCAIEVSSSGTGLHIFGVAPPGLEHSCRRDDLGLEFYTTERFVALTGTNAVGDVATAARPEVLDWLVTYFFPPRGGLESVDWSEEPVPEWRGPTSDEDLLRRAMKSVSAGSAFAGRASFADLWNANTEVLARTWPSTSSAWDGSAADSALASHLAFWTGKDCGRILRLMNQSALKRDKWEREDYIVGTILKACAVSKEVLQDKPIELPGSSPTLSAPGALAPASEGRLTNGSTFVSADDQLALFKGCVYVRSLHRVWTPAGELLKPEAFRVAYGGYSFIMSNDNGKVSTDAWEAFTQSQAVRHPQVSGVCFRPRETPGGILYDGGRDLVNIYLPVETPRLAGDASPFFNHMARLLPSQSDRDILMAYLAACVQHKGVKFQWAPLIQGVEGNGKTFFSFCTAFAIGAKYVHWPKASQLGSQFNGWLHGKLLYCVEDIYTPRNKAEVIEELKPMITGKNLEIQNKGVDQETKDVCGNFIFNTNHKSGVVKTRNDRRFAMFYTAQQENEHLARDGLDGAYMSNLYDWANGEGAWEAYGPGYGFSIVSELLHTWPIPEHLNPAIKCQRAPITSSTHAALMAGRGLIEQYVMEAVEEGKSGFRGGWISSLALTRLLDDQRLKLSPASRPDTLKALGYIPHPGLPGGRVHSAVMPDGGKPVLYVKEGTPLAQLVEYHAISKAYSDAQLMEA
ncbi:hypothetical protein B2_13 [Stenotrophomonas phage B2]|nr:hypothetical protein B2_13 [Stenotrophomonas phage B2]